MKLRKKARTRAATGDVTLGPETKFLRITSAHENNGQAAEVVAVAVATILATQH